MPFGFEELDDDWPHRRFLDPSDTQPWATDIWPWWRSLFAESPSDLEHVLVNMEAGTDPQSTLKALQEAQLIIEAGLLMLMFDTSTRIETAPQAKTRKATHRDNLVNVRKGDLVAFVERLRLRGVAGKPLDALTAATFKSYRYDDHGRLHEDMIRYLFQEDLISDEIANIWMTEAAEGERGDLAQEFKTLGRAFLTYCFASPLRRLRLMIRTSAPMVPLIQECGARLDNMEYMAWSDALLQLLQVCGGRLRTTMPESVFAGFVLNYLNGCVLTLMNSDDPMRPDRLDHAVAGLDFFFGSMMTTAPAPEA